MKISLEREILLDTPPDVTWKYLKDIPFLSRCIPGAKITEELDDNVFNGNITTKIGPIKAIFGGQMEVLTCDDTKREIHIRGSGRAQSAQSRASLNLTARVLNSESNGSTINGIADVEVIGKLASVGGRLIPSVANVIIDDFAKNLEQNIQSSWSSDNESISTQNGSPEHHIELAARSLSLPHLLLNMIKRIFSH